MDFKKQISEILEKQDGDQVWKLLRVLQSLPDEIISVVSEYSKRYSKESVDKSIEYIENSLKSVLDGLDSLRQDMSASVMEQIESAKKDIYEAIKSAKLEAKDGYTPVKGKDYFDGEPGHTPIKGVDYFDGKPGYTPIKGVDYFDGKNGSPDTPEEISKKLNTLKDSLEIGLIKGLADEISNLKKYVGVRRGGGSSSFIQLADTPDTFVGQSNKVVRVKADETGLEFVTAQSIEDINWGEIGGTLSDQTDLQSALDLKADDADLLNYVPYTGATNDVDLGDHTLTTGGSSSGQSTIDKGLVVNEGGYGDDEADFRAETDSNPNAFVVDASADEVLIGTDTYFTASGSGLPYGSMYIYNLGAGGTTITVSATDTWYEIGTGVTGGTTNLVTFQNNHELKVLKAGTYKIDWGLSVELGAANQEIEGTIMINGTANTSFAGMAEFSTANRTNHISGTGIISLAANDLISLAVLDHTSAQNITIDHLTLSVVMVGG